MLLEHEMTEVDTDHHEHCYSMFKVWCNVYLYKLCSCSVIAYVLDDEGCVACDEDGTPVTQSIGTLCLQNLLVVLQFIY